MESFSNNKKIKEENCRLKPQITIVQIIYVQKERVRKRVPGMRKGERCKERGSRVRGDQGGS